MNNLPIIVGYGGINAAGRSIFDFAHKRMVYDSLSRSDQKETIKSLAALTGNNDVKFNLENSLIRKIDNNFFKKNSLRDPAMSAHAGGQLPSPFDPSTTYNARQHPRALAMTILAVSDAIKSIGIEWDEITKKVSLEKISCISGCAVAQADKFGMGGMFQASLSGSRITSKHLAMSLGEMSADFAHSYVLGSMGVTGNHTGACATFQYNLRLGIDLIASGHSKICLVGAAESGLVPEVYEAFAATKGLAEDNNLIELQKSLGEAYKEVNYRKACRPFGENVGMSLGEAAQFIVLMSHDLALELGCNIHGAALSSHIHADGYKKSISGPGAGNYLTVGKIFNDISNSFGHQALQKTIFHAHGTGTPQNRITESHVISNLAKTFKIKQMPLVAIKSYLGHSLAAAGGDQIISMMGSWNTGLLPGIKTIPAIADNVYKDNIDFCLEDRLIDDISIDFAILNAKGFGGNNGTALVMSPNKTFDTLSSMSAKKSLKEYLKNNEEVQKRLLKERKEVVNKPPIARYIFGKNVIDGEEDIKFDNKSLYVSKINQHISIESQLPYKKIFKKDDKKE